jgi:Cys-tRNA(Pro)/Cys-tRNA(Cys) deacylase
MSSEVQKFLEKSGVPFRRHAHQPCVSSHDYRITFPFDPAAVIKSLVFQLPDASFVIIGLRLQARADYKRISDAVGIRRSELRVASVEQLSTELDMQSGGVSPLPIKGARILLDSTIMDLVTIFCGSGRNDATIEILTRDLIRITQATIFQLSRSE